MRGLPPLSPQPPGLFLFPVISHMLSRALAAATQESILFFSTGSLGPTLLRKHPLVIGTISRVDAEFHEGGMEPSRTEHSQGEQSQAWG